MSYNYKFTFSASNTGLIKQITTHPTNLLIMNKNMNLSVYITHIQGRIEYIGNTVDT